MYGFDCDGVLTIGLTPSSIDDVIITGRSYEEATETLEYLRNRGIRNQVFFNPIPFVDKTRASSGQWKAKMIKVLGIKRFFEDDEIQIAEILKVNPEVEIIHINHNLTEKENVRYNAKGEEQKNCNPV